VNEYNEQDVRGEGPAYIVTDKGRAMLEKFANAQPGQVIELTPEEALGLHDDLLFTPKRLRGEETQEWKSERLGTGDLASSERGSGARFNANKAPLHLIPSDILAEWAQRRDDPDFVVSENDTQSAENILVSLGLWQRREVDATYLLAHFSSDEIREAAWVLDFGRKKYAEWNWAKGMAWSIPVGCIQRHALAILDGELTDSDSGRSHMGHILCNVIMLVHFERYYPEGDDRPPVEIFSVPEQTRD
jgi:hypothetical protein